MYYCQAHPCTNSLAPRLLAILGPSGAGKTTLLNILAGQLPFNKNIELTGRVLANGRPLDSLLGHVGFVAQEDIFYSQLTVRYLSCLV